ncbi:hypothetical protein F5Y06DRAFT_308664, partial [Hypoxylon sp. FL0890]
NIRTPLSLNPHHHSLKQYNHQALSLTHTYNSTRLVYFPSVTMPIHHYASTSFPISGADEFINIGDLQAGSVQRGPTERCPRCKFYYYRCWCNVGGGNGSGGNGSGGNGTGGNGSGSNGSGNNGEGKGGNNGGSGKGKSKDDFESEDDLGYCSLVMLLVYAIVDFVLAYL